MSDKKMKRLKEAAAEHHEAYWATRKASSRLSGAGNRLAHAMRDLKLHRFHFKDLTIEASVLLDNPKITSVTVAELLE